MKINLINTAKAAAIVTAVVITVKAVKAVVAKLKAKKVTTEDVEEESITSAKIFSGNEREDCDCDEACDCAAGEAIGR